MSKRGVMPAVTKRFAADRCMTEYMNMLLIRVFNDYADNVDEELVYRARGKNIELSLIDDATFLSNNTAVKGTYWIPVMPRQLINVMIRLNSVIIQHMKNHDDNDLQSIPEPRNERIMADDCGYPVQLIVNIDRTCSRDIITKISDVMENAIKSIVEYVAITMITVKRFPKITPVLCCMILNMPGMVIDCAEYVETEATRKNEARANAKLHKDHAPIVEHLDATISAAAAAPEEESDVESNGDPDNYEDDNASTDVDDELQQ
jgi:hypothetical protein